MTAEREDPKLSTTGLGERLVWAFLLWLFAMTVGMIVLKIVVN